LERDWQLVQPKETLHTGGASSIYLKDKFMTQITVIGLGLMGSALARAVPADVE
jgi:hypothetical protein